MLDSFILKAARTCEMKLK